MKNCERPELLVSGLGVTSAIGIGKEAFGNALFAGQQAFRHMARPGRQLPGQDNRGTPGFLGAEIDGFTLAPQFRRYQRGSSLSAQVALATVHEAWLDANLDEQDPGRIGLIVGGSNFQQRELLLTQDAFRSDPAYLRPGYGLSFMDTDTCGILTEAFNIRGLAYTVGAASASGQLAILQAIQAVQSGAVDTCIALGALMDISYWECQAFRSMGAMGSDRFGESPAAACRPFDQQHDGFIFGESCAALVIENGARMQRKAVAPYARPLGWALVMDGNRNPNPSVEGESQAITRALASAGLDAADIDYVNPHGTGSVIGDETELAALRRCRLEHASINNTKSLIGHGLSAAATTELAAVLLQMRAGRLHPCRNLDDPIDPEFNWVRQASTKPPHNVLKLSMGFGGINTAICLQAIYPQRTD